MSLLHEYRAFKTEVKQLKSDLRDIIPTDQDLARYSELVKFKKVHKKMKKTVNSCILNGVCNGANNEKLTIFVVIIT